MSTKKRGIYIAVILALLSASIIISVVTFPHLPKASDGSKYITEDRLIQLMSRGSGLCWDKYITQYPEFGLEKNAYLNRKYVYHFSKEELAKDKVSVVIESFDKVHYSKNGDYYDLTATFTIETTIRNVRTIATVRGKVTTKTSRNDGDMIGNFIKSPEVTFSFK